MKACPKCKNTYLTPAIKTKTHGGRMSAPGAERTWNENIYILYCFDCKYEEVKNLNPQEQ